MLTEGYIKYSLGPGKDNSKNAFQKGHPLTTISHFTWRVSIP
jgi:hypothetical protein